VAAALPLADELGRLEAVHVWHQHIHENQGEIVVEQATQSLFAGMRLHQLDPKAG
jgi:hypothetical protein